MKKISVIIPTFNTEKYISKCLNSVVHQTYKNIEILLIYKESKDNSLNIIKSYQEKDKRIKIIFQDDGGLGGARNLGILKSSGEYIFFLDSDDWLEKETLELLLNKIEKENNDFVMFPFWSYNGQLNKLVKNAWGSKFFLRKELFTKSFSIEDLTPEEFISENAIVVAWNKLYKKEFLINNDIFFPENIRFEDNSFYYNALIKAKSVSVVNEHLLYYRINREGSLQDSDYDSKSVLDIVYIFNLIYKLIKKSKVSRDFYDQFEKYMINEFCWRFQLMNKNRLPFLLKIKELCTNQQFFTFLDKLNFKCIKKHEKSKKVKISIIIPVYNVEEYISFCLDSLICQTLEDIELIFIDDCSLDKSINTVVNYALFDERIKIFYNDKNLGAGAARNVGLSQALGEYVLFIDPDDLLSKEDILEKMYACITKNKVLAICANIGVVSDKYETDKIIKKYNGYNVQKEGMYSYKDYNVWPSWGFTRFLYNKEFLENNNIVFPNYLNYEDPIFLVNVLTKIDKFYGLPDIVYLYRQTIKQKVYNYQKIVDTLESFNQLFSIYKTNQLFDNYRCEYNNLINYIKNYIKPYIKYKKKDYQFVTDKVNELLISVDKKILNSEENKIYKNIKEIKEPFLLKRIVSRMKRKILKIFFGEKND